MVILIAIWNKLSACLILQRLQTGGKKTGFEVEIGSSSQNILALKKTWFLERLLYSKGISNQDLYSLL